MTLLRELAMASSTELWLIIAAETVLLLFLEKSSFLSTFAARKACHGGTGLLLLLLDSRNLIAHMYVYIMVLASLAMTWELGLPAFRFGKPKDKGISIYLVIVGAWFYFQLPSSLLAPVFFADPLGAIVGRSVAKYVPRLNCTWYQQKTVLGSTAVLLATFGCLYLGPGAAQLGVTEKLILSVMASVAEAVGGEYDNLALALVVLPTRYFLAPW